MSDANPTRPSPLELGDLDVMWSAQERGASYREALEALLLELPAERADPLMQLLREGRGAWFPMLRSSRGELLFVGNALSGAIVPLAAYGFRVTVLDPSEDRLRFAQWRGPAGSALVFVVDAGGDRLPFDDQSFDVVVQEDGLTGRGMFARAIAECSRVSCGEVVIGADNRLAYKRSSGRRSDFRVPGALEFVRRALSPPRKERTLHGYRRALSAQAGFVEPRAFALYPHAHDFSHVVALDERRPALTIGPRERKNKMKLAARAIGLFPVLTPSFTLVATRAGLARERTRIERMLLEIAQKTGEPLPSIEHLVATRGNTVVVHTSVAGASESEPLGRWTLHIPLSPKNIPQLELHVRTLERLWADFPQVPAPKSLGYGRFDGAWTSCERRLPGWSAPQVTDGARKSARMIGDASRHFAMLVVRKPALFTDADYEEQLGARFDLVTAHAGLSGTIAALERMREEYRARFVGQSIPRVLYHADLRGKHVQVDREGSVIGYLDWGTTEMDGLPLVDLLHLVIHERKQELGCSAGDAWRIVRDRRGMRGYEEAALSSYATALSLDVDVVRAITELYPVLVAAMAEKNWDYSRPRWLHEQFGI